MKKSRFLALLISLGMLSSPALAAKKFLNNDLNISNRFKKQEPKSGAEQFREDTGMDSVAAFFLYTQCIRELIGYGDGYKLYTDKANIGYAVKKICEYNSKEARKERLRKKLEDIIDKSGLKEKLDKEGRVGNCLRAEMRDQNIVDFFNSVIENKFDYKLAIPRILNEKVVDEMLAVTSMTNKEKNFVKNNVEFYLCPVVFGRDILSLKIYGFLKSYDFLESYKRNPLIIQDVSADTPYKLTREIHDNMVAYVCFLDGQLRNGMDCYSEEYNIKPLNILKKVNGKFVLADTSKEDDDDMSKNYLVGKFFEYVDKRSWFWYADGAFD